MKALELGGQRKLRKITQIQFAQRLGWSQEAVRFIENGSVEITDAQYSDLIKTLDEMKNEGIGTLRKPKRRRKEAALS